MHDHMPAHGKRASQHTSIRPLWKACKLQTYFTAKGLIDYFVVEEAEPSSSPSPLGTRGEPPPSQEEGKLFGALKADIIQASHDLGSRAEIVQGIEESRADRVPWLVRTGFATHLRGLRDAEILSSYALPRSIDLGGRDDRDDDNDGSDFGDDDHINTDLSRILTAADGTLMDAYTSCSEASPDGKITRQRALRLSNFRGGEDNISSAKASKFREFKNGKSLKSYFRIAKQLLIYYYRVVYRDGGHFTREDNNQVLPGDVVEVTSWQEKAMQSIINVLRRQDKTSRVKSGSGGDEERDIDLNHAIRTFYISLICHTVGSRPFRSVVLSFCAMLSRKKNPTRQRDKRQQRLCTWHKPGNFNSNLSSLIWVAQVIIFDFVCFKKQDDEDGIPDMINEIYGKYFQQMAETPFGHILQWQLYLFAASSTNLTKHQARWSLDKETIDYRGIELHMDHISQLVVSEFRQAHTLLYDELLFGMDNIAPIEAWRLHDDLDEDEFGASWMSDERNREILAGTHDALLRQIEGKAALRRVFVRPDRNYHNIDSLPTQTGH